MARARNIKPALFVNELLGTADIHCTVLFISLWCLADCEGKLEDRPMRIKIETFPYRDDVTQPLFNGYLTDLERLGFIQRYSVNGVKFEYALKGAELQIEKLEKELKEPPKVV